MLASFSCTQQGDFSCLSLPYGTLELTIDNHTRRFEPRSKNGVFQSIEERQGIEVYIGVRLANGPWRGVSWAYSITPATAGKPATTP